MLGKTEEVILLTLIRLGETSPTSAADEINKLTPIHLGAVYTILSRMVEKGWVTKRGPTIRGKGTPRGFFTITDAGREALRGSIETTNQFSQGIDL